MQGGWQFSGVVGACQRENGKGQGSRHPKNPAVFVDFSVAGVACVFLWLPVHVQAFRFPIFLSHLLGG